MSIYVGNSEIKNVYVGTTPVKEVYVGTTKVRPYKTVYTFDFQNNGSLNWTAQSVSGTPSYTSGQGWTIGSSSGNYQSAIMPPSSVYDGKKLTKVKIWMYKGQATSYDRKSHEVGCGLTNNDLSNFTSWGQSRYSTSTWVVVVDGSTKWTETTDIVGEVIQEWGLNDDGSMTLQLNGGTQYNLGNYATLFRNLWSNNNLGLSIGRWNAYGNIYIRKVEITTVG